MYESILNRFILIIYIKFLISFILIIICLLINVIFSILIQLEYITDLDYFKNISFIKIYNDKFKKLDADC